MVVLFKKNSARNYSKLNRTSSFGLGPIWRFKWLLALFFLNSTPNDAIIYTNIFCTTHYNRLYSTICITRCTISNYRDWKLSLQSFCTSFWLDEWSSSPEECVSPSPKWAIFPIFDDDWKIRKMEDMSIFQSSEVMYTHIVRNHALVWIPYYLSGDANWRFSWTSLSPRLSSPT